MKFEPMIFKYQLRDAAIYWCIIPAAVILSGRGIDWLAGLRQNPASFIQIAFSLFLLLPGLALIAVSTRDLSRAGGTPNPLRPAQYLVTTGAYSICRHPMFLGYDLCAAAVVWCLGSPGTVLVSFPLFIILQILFLKKEEKILLLKFKQTYLDYMRKTPLLVPAPFFCRQNTCSTKPD